MVLINSRTLAGMYKKMGRKQCVSHLRESMVSGDLKPDDFSLEDLAEGLMVDRRGEPMGRDYVRALDPRRQGDYDSQQIIEAVDSSAFANITGQILINTVLDAYNNTAFVGDQFVTNVPTMFNGEKIPGVTNLGDDSQIVQEGKPYPRAGVSEDWIETPATDKRGLIVEVTKEAIFFDRTGQFLDRASKVGESLGLNKEKRILDMVLGVTNNYRWKGTDYDTYQTTTPWDNVTASNALLNYKSIDAVLETVALLIDPATGEPILEMPDTIWLKTNLVPTLNAILHSTQVELQPNASANTANINQYVPNNIVVGTYKTISSPLLDTRFVAGSVTGTDWFLGSPTGAFHYMENWPITVVPMPPNSYAEWDYDVVAGWKASERGTVAVVQPRKVGKSTV